MINRAWWSNRPLLGIERSRRRTARGWGLPPGQLLIPALRIREETELVPSDCEILAGISQSRRKPDQALAWGERGLELQKQAAGGRGASYKLADMRRKLQAGPSFRDRTERRKGSWIRRRGSGNDGGEMAALKRDSNWQKLTPAQREAILAKHGLNETVSVDVSSPESILDELERGSLSQWADRTQALKRRFEQARLDAAKVLQPKVRRVDLPRRTINDEAELADWLEEAGQLVCDALEDGPVMI